MRTARTTPDSHPQQSELRMIETNSCRSLTSGVDGRPGVHQMIRRSDETGTEAVSLSLSLSLSQDGEWQP
jgi:hypothetical protein